MKNACLFCLLIGYSLFYLSSCKEPFAERPGHSSLVDSVMEKSTALRNSGQLQLSLAFLDSSFKVMPNPRLIDLWYQYDFKANFYINYKHDYKTARTYIDSMYFCLRGNEARYKLEYANTIFSDGDLWLALNNYGAAYKRYYEGKKFAQDNLDSCRYSVFSGRLAILKYRQEDFREAIPYVKQALAELSYCHTDTSYADFFFVTQNHFNTLALCYERAEMPDSAVYYYKQGLAFIDANKNKYPNRTRFIEMATGIIYGNLGGVYVKLKNYPQAIHYLNESIRLNYRPGYEMVDAQTAQLKLAGLYLEQDRLEAADTLLQRVENDLLAAQKRENVGDRKPIYARLLKLQWAYADRLKDLPRAYAYMQQYYKLKDSMDAVVDGLNKQNLEAGLKDAEAHFNAELMLKENRLKTVYLAGLVLFCLMVVVILLMLWFNLKRSARSVKELVKLNQIITDKNIQMQNALSSLEQSQQENTRLLKVVAHDLRNPIGGIATLSDMMLREGNYSKQDREMLELIKTSGYSSLDLINDLLQFTAQETFVKEPVDMFNLVKYCVELMRLKAKEKQQEIEMDAVHVEAYLNREKMWRVLSNLIANAIKFSPSGTNILVRMMKADDHIIMSVKDSGIGIPEHMKDKIFDMFTEARRVGTSGEQPFGMGLAITKQIVEAHNGSIWFNSNPGEGTVFYVELPLK